MSQGRSRTGPATRAALIDAAVSVVVESGWQAAGVREIATRAGVPVGGIHYHFGGRERLLVTAVMAQILAMFATPARLIDQARDLDQLLTGTLGWTASPDVTPAQRLLLLEVMAQARRDVTVATELDRALVGYRFAVAAALVRVGVDAVNGTAGEGGGAADEGGPALSVQALAAALVAQANGLWLQSTVESGFPIDVASAAAIQVWRAHVSAIRTTAMAAT